MDTGNGVVRVVARFQDGRILKGTTHDFGAEHAAFHLKVEGETGPPVKVPISALKAVFFVKSFEGSKSRKDERGFERAPNHGRRVRVFFKDGEEIAGITVSFSPDRPGFFIVPADEGSNNVRIFVVRAAVKTLQWVPVPARAVTS